MACVYVAYGRDGLIKIGRSTNFKRRISALRQDFRRFGNDISGWKQWDELSDHAAFVCEFRLIDKLGEVFDLYHGREWFIGDNDLAIHAAEISVQEAILHRPPPKSEYTKKQLEQMHDERRALRKRQAAETAARMAIYRQGVEKRRLIREARRAEIAERQASLRNA